MSQIDYASMTLDEAKRYFLENRHNQEAFFAYMDKLEQSGRAIVVDPTDPESEAIAILAIKQKLDLHKKTECLLLRGNVMKFHELQQIVESNARSLQLTDRISELTH